jgi:hypothetical protein
VRAGVGGPAARSRFAARVPALATAFSPLASGVGLEVEWAELVHARVPSGTGSAPRRASRFRCAADAVHSSPVTARRRPGGTRAGQTRGRSGRREGAPTRVPARPWSRPGTGPSLSTRCRMREASSSASCSAGSVYTVRPRTRRTRSGESPGSSARTPGASGACDRSCPQSRWAASCTRMCCRCSALAPGCTGCSRRGRSSPADRTGPPRPPQPAGPRSGGHAVRPGGPGRSRRRRGPAVRAPPRASEPSATGVCATHR